MASLQTVSLSRTTPGPSGLRRASERPRHMRDSSLCEFIRRMRAEPAAEFQTKEAAADFDVTPFVFIRAFKKLTGLSPQRFRAALRIELAKRLLVDTDRPVTEISFDAGYNSLGTFVRTFTLLVGISPTQLRRLSRGAAPDDLFGNLSAISARQGTTFVSASLEAPPPGKLLAAGLFPQGMPSGLPYDGCIVDPTAPEFRLVWPEGRRRAYLLAAAVEAFSLHDAWAGRLGALDVCKISLPTPPLPDGGTRIRLRLRPLAGSDPPFLTPVPLLILLQSRMESRSFPGSRF